MNSNYDVIVSGGGTAGILAAIAAARNGAKTLLIERWGHLGGTAAFGLPFLGIFSGAGEQVNSGLAQELIDRMVAAGGSLGHVHGANWEQPLGQSKYSFSLTPFDPEVLKYVAQEMALEAGTKLLFHTFVSGIIKDNNYVKGVKVFNKSGQEAFFGKVVIDATGDADVANLAGASFQTKTELQNASIVMRIGNVDLNKFVDALKKEDHVKGWGSWHTRLVQKENRYIHVAGHLVPWSGESKEVTFTAVSVRDGEIYLNATRTVNVDGTSADDLSRAEISERKNVFSLMGAMTKNVPGMENAYLISTSPIGIRESRNILGDYTLTKEDVIECRQFDDSIARGAYPIDIHDPAGGRTQFTFLRNGGSYSIPYRSLVPMGIEGLLIAGRCISASKEAVGSARLMGTALSQGQAAGTAAALAVAEGKGLRQLDISVLRDTLSQQGSII